MWKLLKHQTEHEGLENLRFIIKTKEKADVEAEPSENPTGLVSAHTMLNWRRDGNWLYGQRWRSQPGEGVQVLASCSWAMEGWGKNRLIDRGFIFINEGVFFSWLWLSQNGKYLIYCSIYMPTLTCGHEGWIRTKSMRFWIHIDEILGGLAQPYRVRSFKH